MQIRPPFTPLLAVAVLALPTLAHAHTGLHNGFGFIAGLGHPLFGLDHLLAMVAVGLWAAQRGGRALWALPLGFVSAMALGALLPLAAPVAEGGILLSLLALGALVGLGSRLPLLAALTLTAGAGLCHGAAHGAEMPATASALGYGAGFLLTTTALHLAGIGLALLLRRSAWVRAAGWLVAGCGAALALG